MAENFFDLVGDNFFLPFTNSNKRLNFTLLQIINKNMKNQMTQFSRSDVIDWLIDYYENCPTLLIDDDTGQEEDTTDYRKIASDKLRYFMNSGWLISENTNDLESTYQMDPIAIHLLNTMEEMVVNDTKPIEFTGYVFSIYNALKTFEFAHATAIVEQMVKSSNNLNNNLRGLSTSIKKYLNNLLRKGNIEAKKILNTILVDYQDRVILKAFNNLRVKDNPSKYKGWIIDCVRTYLKDENLNKMIANYIQTKKDGIENEANIEEARKFFIQSLDSVQSQFEDIEENIKILNERNTKYVSTANSRINYLLNQQQDIEGRIFALLKLIDSSDDKIEERTSFQAYEFGKADEFSLFVPRNNKNRIKSEIRVFEDIQIDDDEFRRQDELLKRELMFSSISINKFIMNQLENREIMKASEIKVNDFDDIIRIFLAQIYSENSHMGYYVTLTTKTFRALNSELSEYEIIRRK